MKSTHILKLTALILSFVSPALAQQGSDAPHALTTSDYARAEKWMGYNTNPLVFRSGVRPAWQGDDRFWYRVTTPEGSEFVMVETAKGTRTPAFDHVKLAAALSAVAGTTIDPHRLPFTDFELSADGQTITVVVQRRRWKCDLATYQCTADSTASTAGQRAGGGRGGTPIDILSPDKKRAAFIRDFNLWVRDVATGKETQLTTDGVKDFGYATDNAGGTHSDRAVLLWSPDSKKIATFQQDQRGVGEMYLVETKVGHPTLQAWKYPLPGEEVVTMIQRVIIEVDGPRPISIALPCAMTFNAGEVNGPMLSGLRMQLSLPLSRPRAITNTSSFASPTRRPEQFVRCSKRQPPRNTSRAREDLTGATCRP